MVIRSRWITKVAITMPHIESTKRRALKDATAMQYYFPSFVTILLGVFLGATILNVYDKDVSEVAARLVEGLIWPFFVISLIFLFRDQADALLNTLISKIYSANKLTGIGFSIEGPQQIPIPKSGEHITLANIALIHTSFLREDKTRALNDGSSYYQIEVAVVAPRLTLDRIASVVYRLDPTYPKNVYAVADRQSRFKLKELANGPSIIRAEIKFKDQDELLRLNRFIDLRPDGPVI